MGDFGQNQRLVSMCSYDEDDFVIVEKTREQKLKQIRQNRQKLSKYLGNYGKYFKRDIDELWERKDMAKNGYLDQETTLEFIKKLQKSLVDKQRAQNFNQDHFSQIFAKFDQDKNGYIDKGEMAVFIKQVFKKTQTQKVKENVKSKSANFENLGYLLGNYAQNFQITLDILWNNQDVDQNGFLDKEECRLFLRELVKYTTPQRAQNYNENDFDQLFHQYDDDKNGFISKSEMAVFIKKAFKNQEMNKLPKFCRSVKIKQQIRVKTSQLTKLLGEFSTNFEVCLDELWQDCDYDSTGNLDQLQCRDFLNEAQRHIKKDRPLYYNSRMFYICFEQFAQNGNQVMKKEQMKGLMQFLFKSKLIYLIEDPTRLTPDPMPFDIMKSELIEWYQFIRCCFNELKQFISCQPQNQYKYQKMNEKNLKEVKDRMLNHLQLYAEQISRFLRLLYQNHGSDEVLFQECQVYYQYLQDHLVCVEELLDKQNTYLEPQEIAQFKNAVVSSFSADASYIQGAFNSTMRQSSFYDGPYQHFEHIFKQIQNMVQNTQLNNKNFNNLEFVVNDSSHFQSQQLQQMSEQFHLGFTYEAKEGLFANCDAISFHENDERCKFLNQTIANMESYGKTPGGKYINNLLKATIYYEHNNILKLVQDLKNVIALKKGVISSIEIRKDPFLQIKIQSKYQNKLLCQYDIQIKDQNQILNLNNSYINFLTLVSQSTSTFEELITSFNICISQNQQVQQLDQKEVGEEFQAQDSMMAYQETMPNDNHENSGQQTVESYTTGGANLLIPSTRQLNTKESQHHKTISLLNYAANAAEPIKEEPQTADQFDEVLTLIQDQIQYLSPRRGQKIQSKLEVAFSLLNSRFDLMRIQDSVNLKSFDSRAPNDFEAIIDEIIINLYMKLSVFNMQEYLINHIDLAKQAISNQTYNNQHLNNFNGQILDSTLNLSQTPIEYQHQITQTDQVSNFEDQQNGTNVVNTKSSTSKHSKKVTESHIGALISKQKRKRSASRSCQLRELSQKAQDLKSLIQREEQEISDRQIKILDQSVRITNYSESKAETEFGYSAQGKSQETPPVRQQKIKQSESGKWTEMLSKSDLVSQLETMFYSMPRQQKFETSRKLLKMWNALGAFPLINLIHDDQIVFSQHQVEVLQFGIKLQEDHQGLYVGTLDPDTGFSHGVGRKFVRSVSDASHGSREYISVYEGQFINGQQSGYGRVIYSGGRCYIGQWLNGDYHGKGKRYEGNGSMFEDGWYLNSVLVDYAAYLNYQSSQNTQNNSEYGHTQQNQIQEYQQDSPQFPKHSAHFPTQQSSIHFEQQNYQPAAVAPLNPRHLTFSSITTPEPKVHIPKLPVDHCGLVATSGLSSHSPIVGRRFNRHATNGGDSMMQDNSQEQTPAANTPVNLQNLRKRNRSPLQKVLEERIDYNNQLKSNLQKQTKVTLLLRASSQSQTRKANEYSQSKDMQRSQGFSNTKELEDHSQYYKEASASQMINHNHQYLGYSNSATSWNTTPHQHMSFMPEQIIVSDQLINSQSDNQMLIQTPIRKTVSGNYYNYQNGNSDYIIKKQDPNKQQFSMCKVTENKPGQMTKETKFNPYQNYLQSNHMKRSTSQQY